ncbi:MAG: MBOAT family protein [Myxococcaceae bacterium]|nr:MBOAT family protein [Myxococcaceae bacterium]
MLFNSYAFLVGFLPLALIAFFGLGRMKSMRWALGALVVASITFYAYWDWHNLKVLVPSLVVNFVLGRALTARAEQKQPTQLLVTLGVIFNLGLLGYFKYTDFLLQTATQLSGMPFALQHIVLPLGISFFTFEQIAYIVDSSRGKSRPYSFLEYLLFVTFFPHLIAGPIIQHDELLNQLDDKTRRFNTEAFTLGLTLLIFGLFKKVVLADALVVNVGPVYDDTSGQVPTFFNAWLATLCYSLQLYFDFSGYSDMAIGLARMFNLKLPANFDSPYKAHNIIDFWRRWHMTLSRFLRNYLYIPLGGNRGGKTRRYVNLMLTMLLGGLWHGAGWGFVIWGGLNGIFLVINNLFRSWRGANKENTPEGPFWLVELSGGFTFICIMLSRVSFRSPNLDTATVVFKGLLGQGGWAIAEGLRSEAKTVALALALFAVCRFMPNTQELLATKQPVFQKVTPRRLQFEWNPRWAVVVGAMAVASLMLLTRVSEFLYFQF